MKIYKVNIMDCEGRHTQTIEYFEDIKDAWKFAEWTPEGHKNPQNTSTIDTLQVWATGTYSKEEVLKRQALNKLTKEERNALGFE